MSRCLIVNRNAQQINATNAEIISHATSTQRFFYSTMTFNYEVQTRCQFHGSFFLSSYDKSRVNAIVMSSKRCEIMDGVESMDTEILIESLRVIHRIIRRWNFVESKQRWLPRTNYNIRNTILPQSTVASAVSRKLPFIGNGKTLIILTNSCGKDIHRSN